MAKKKIDSTEKIKNEELVTTKSVTSIISEDKNNIADATSEAKKNIDSVVYADNLVPPSKNSKSIRSLNIEEKKTKKNEDIDKIVEIKKEEKSISKTNSAESTTKKTQTKKSSNKSTKKSVVISEENNLEDKKIELNNIENDKNKDVSLNVETKEKETEIRIETDTKDISSDLKAEEIKEEIIKPTTEKKSHKALFIISFSIIATLLLLLVFSTIFAIITGTKTTIINGIKIKDIDVSGLSKEQAIEKVSNTLNEKVEKEITLKYNNYEITVFPSQFDVSFTIENAVNLAYKKGRMRKYFRKQL